MTLTQTELDQLMLPLTSLPGFNPVGLHLASPFANDGKMVYIHWLCVDRDTLNADDGAINCWCGEDNGFTGWIERRQWYLDLADASTADRVARWVAERLGLRIVDIDHHLREHSHLECTAPVFFVNAYGQCIIGRDRIGARTSFHGWRQDDPDKILALQDLDQYDRRQLADGSRYVERLGLAIVAFHVGDRG